MEDDIVYFMGALRGPGHYLLVSEKKGVSKRPDVSERKQLWADHRPPDFPWSSMDRHWSATGFPQGTALIDMKGGWTVLSVADYTQDSRPNVVVSFAVQREVFLDEMKKLAAERYPQIWSRLGVKM